MRRLEKLLLFGTILSITPAQATLGHSFSCDTSSVASTFLPSVTCSRQHITQAIKGTAPCQPRDKVIKLPRPNHTSVDQLTPSHVTVKRCSGGCYSQHKDCVPAHVQKRKVPVMMGRCPIGGGKCEKECAAVEVEDHTACSCGCQQQEESCSEDQTYDLDTCSCRCRNHLAMMSCLEAGRSWDLSSCSCICPPSKTCTEGQILDLISCACLLKEFQGLQNVYLEERNARTTSAPFPLNLEHLAIIILGCLNVIFVVIIVVLASRNHTLNRKLKKDTQRNQTRSKEIFTCSQTEDLKKKTSYCEDSTKLQVFPSDSDLCRNLLSSDSSEMSSEVSSHPSASPGLQPSCSPFHSINTQPFPSQSHNTQGQMIYRPMPSYSPSHCSITRPNYNPNVQGKDDFSHFCSRQPDFRSQKSHSSDFPPPPPSPLPSLFPFMPMDSS